MDHAISNVTYFLTNSAGESIEVKIDNWNGEIKDSNVPQDYESALESKVAEITGNNSFEVVGYAIKAGTDMIVKGEQPEGTDLKQNTNDIVFNFSSNPSDISLVENKYIAETSSDEEPDSDNESEEKVAASFVEEASNEESEESDDGKSKGGKSEDDSEEGEFADDDESIDLSSIVSNNVANMENGEEDKLEIDLDSIIDSTDDDNDITIIGDDGDIVTFTDDENLNDNQGWTKGQEGTTVEGQDGEFDEYTNTNNSNVTVYIDTDIDVDDDI